MLKIENALLIDICLGFPLGKIWLPSNMPEVKANEIPPTFILKGDQLAAFKKLALTEDRSAIRALEGIRTRADSYLTIPNPSVVQKPVIPPGVHLHDYYSLAKYWWPNPDSADGKPYLMRDGYVNPECYSEIYDISRLEIISEAAVLLAIAAFLTDNRDYANKAVSMIKTWIVDPDTMQTPHFKFAQVVPGKEDLRYQSIIEARRFIYVCEALQILRYMEAINEKDFLACLTWFRKLLHWLQSSEQGIKASKAKNNIGIWYDLERLVFALFTGQDELIQFILKNSMPARIEQQIDDEGKLIEELNREKPYDYVVFTLLALAELSNASKCGEINLSDFSITEGRNFQNAFTWFNETIESNKLEQPAVALVQWLSAQRQLTQFKEENRFLKEALNNKEEIKGNVYVNDESKYFTNTTSETEQKNYSQINISETTDNIYRMKVFEKECNQLRSELNDLYRNIMMIAIQYRGVDLILREQSKGLKKKQEEIKRLKIKLKRNESRYKEIKKSRIWRYILVLQKFKNAIVSKICLQEIKQIVMSNKSNDLSNTDAELCTQKFEKKDPIDKKNIHPVELIRNVKLNNIEFLKKEYEEKGLDKEPDTFALYRIIGNDLYPRHKKGQSRENLQFILEKEAEFENCKKIFIVNRVVDKEEEKAIFKLLNDCKYEYIHIPFKPEEYKCIGFDIEALPRPGYLISEEFESLKEYDKLRVISAVYRLKNIYLMNNNGARNIALRDGKNRAKWILPWDGNCFITPLAWKEIYSDIIKTPYLKYFVVPMARIIDNNNLLKDNFSPDPVEEPQLIFRKDSSEEFNKEFYYGRRPKVELMWRLGIPGKWDFWIDRPCDQERRSASSEAKTFGVAGWVARLFSGMEDLEKDDRKSLYHRAIIRLKSIKSFIENINLEVSEVTPDGLNFYEMKTLEGEKEQYCTSKNEKMSIIVDQLIQNAKQAITRGPYSVTDKESLPPSNNINDYFHPSPFWWPNPDTPDGLPYIRRDGERVPGTRLYEPESDKYDRTRLQHVFDDSTILALTWIFTGELTYAHHGALILEKFFVNPFTAMTPHLKYGQVIMGKNNNIGNGAGIIEMKDLYFYLDSVRILTSSGVIKDKTIQGFKCWLSEYLDWLLSSPQGKKERCELNNHGTYYDLQVASIASFLGESSTLYDTLARAQSRIKQQFKNDGSQPEELMRTNTAHYCCFNFQGWVNLAKIASLWGVDFWSYKAISGESLKKGANWLFSHLGKDWPYEQIGKFEFDRFYHIWFIVPEGIIEAPIGVDLPISRYEVKPLFFPHDGVRPYWNLGLK